MRISATTDYALRAVVEIASRSGESTVTAQAVGTAQDIPANFLRAILAQLRRAGLVTSLRGPDGGWQLARPAETISLAEIVRAVDGPLASVRGARPECARFPGPAAPLQLVWVAVRASVREVLEAVSVADVVAGTLPDSVLARTGSQDAWRAH